MVQLSWPLDRRSAPVFFRVEHEDFLGVLLETRPDGLDPFARRFGHCESPTGQIAKVTKRVANSATKPTTSNRSRIPAGFPENSRLASAIELGWAAFEKRYLYLAEHRNEPGIESRVLARIDSVMAPPEPTFVLKESAASPAKHESGDISVRLVMKLSGAREPIRLLGGSVL